MNNRKAVLGFIAQLGVSELVLFFQLLMKSLQITDLGNDGVGSYAWVSGKSNLDELDLSSWSNLFTMERILAIPLKKRYGFLHVVEEIFRIFDASRVSPFLDLLLFCVVRVLESCASSIPSTNNKQSAQPEDFSEITLPEGGKEAVSHVGVILTMVITIYLSIMLYIPPPPIKLLILGWVNIIKYCFISTYLHTSGGPHFLSLPIKTLSYVLCLIFIHLFEGSNQQNPTTIAPLNTCAQPKWEVQWMTDGVYNLSMNTYVCVLCMYVVW